MSVNELNMKGFCKHICVRNRHGF